MSSSSPTRYADWKAPAGDGEIILWPDRAALVEQTRQNHARLKLATHVKVQNVPLRELRTQMRRWIGHADDEKLLIATGHQTELYHPGVWAKHAMINALANAVDGGAYFLAVDTDAPKHLQLKWPGGGGAITDDPSVTKAEWSGRLKQPTPAHLAKLRDDVAAARANWSFRPQTDVFFDAMTTLGADGAVPLSDAITNATHALDRSLGLRHHATPCSPMFFGEPFLAFVHHVCAHAGEFAGAYNASLREYRVENGIENPGRPMPDLKTTDGACESPLWLDDLSNGTRDRLTLLEVDGRWALVMPDDAFAFDPTADGWDAAAKLGPWLRSHNLRLSPRALTLTMFIRLLLVDQFAHGIGGGRYDQVLDKLIARHFRLDPPRFSVATATLFFPDAVKESRACMPCLRQEGHQLKHRVLGERKMDLVSAISAAPRRSLERATLFADMHRELKAHARDPIVLDWERRMAETDENLARHRMLFDRELFYGLQSRERLESIIEKYRDALAP
jgi:hypothetical protein